MPDTTTLPAHPGALSDREPLASDQAGDKPRQGAPGDRSRPARNGPGGSASARHERRWRDVQWIDFMTEDEAEGAPEPPAAPPEEAPAAFPALRRFDEPASA